MIKHQVEIFIFLDPLLFYTTYTSFFTEMWLHNTSATSECNHLQRGSLEGALFESQTTTESMLDIATKRSKSFKLSWLFRDNGMFYDGVLVYYDNGCESYLVTVTRIYINIYCYSTIAVAIITARKYYPRTL